MKLPVTEMIDETINRLLTMLDGGDWHTQAPFTASLMLRDSVTKGPGRSA
jgi:LacI family asc operon transcriptional repressor